LQFEEGNDVMISKEDYQDKLEESLREWNSRISILKAEAERQNGKEKPEHKRRVTEILDQKAALEAMIGELQRASGKKWIELKDKIQEAQADFEASYKTTMMEYI
jgi:hypothetical protein